MDSKLKLLKEFYAGLPQDRAKIETPCHGFEFLETLLEGGITLEYGEMHRSALLNKYKLSHIPGDRMDDLLRAHIGKACNVCLYFHEDKSRIFCLNLDNNNKTNNTELLPEIKLAIDLLLRRLTALGCDPLIIASGRGYHLWCRLAVPYENQTIHQFMLRLTALTLAGLHNQGLDYNQIKVNFYPDPRVRSQVSLRLFGSEHARNQVFSRVYTTQGLLDEAASWTAFEDHLRHKTIPGERFQQAVDTLLAAY